MISQMPPFSHSLYFYSKATSPHKCATDLSASILKGIHFTKTPFAISHRNKVGSDKTNIHIIFVVIGAVTAVVIAIYLR